MSAAAAWAAAATLLMLDDADDTAVAVLEQRAVEDQATGRADRTDPTVAQAVAELARARFGHRGAQRPLDLSKVDGRGVDVDVMLLEAVCELWRWDVLLPTAAGQPTEDLLADALEAFAEARGSAGPPAMAAAAWRRVVAVRSAGAGGDLTARLVAMDELVHWLRSLDEADPEVFAGSLALALAWLAVDPLKAAELSLAAQPLNRLDGARAELVAAQALLRLGLFEVADELAGAASAVFDAHRRSASTPTARAAASARFAAAFDTSIACSIGREDHRAAATRILEAALEAFPSAAPSVLEPVLLGGGDADAGEAGAPTDPMARSLKPARSNRWWWGMRRSGDHLWWALVPPTGSDEAEASGAIRMTPAHQSALLAAGRSVPMVTPDERRTALSSTAGDPYVAAGRPLVTGLDGGSALLTLGEMLVPPAFHSVIERSNAPLDIELCVSGDLAWLPFGLLGVGPRERGRADQVTVPRLCERATICTEVRIDDGERRHPMGEAAAPEGRRGVAAAVLALGGDQFGDRFSGLGTRVLAGPGLSSGAVVAWGANERSPDRDRSVLFLCGHAEPAPGAGVVTPDRWAGQRLVLNDAGETLGVEDVRSSDLGNAFIGAVLCACHSAGTPALGSDEWTGLGAAFLASGMDWVVATRWPVWLDRALVSFVNDLLDGLEDGARPERVVRRLEADRLARCRALGPRERAHAGALDGPMFDRSWGAWTVLAPASA